MGRSKSSKSWLKEHFSDTYVKQAQAEGYRSRAIYKLIEIDDKETLLYPGITVIDLGAAPGGWTQYVSQKLDGTGNIIALDILPMDALADVTFILGDFQDELVYQNLLSHIPNEGVDLILSDMAPNMSGNPAIDIPRAMALAELAFDLCSQVLKKDGNVLMKLFHGEGFDQLIKDARQQFSKVAIKKPKASRSRSRETYMLAKGYKMG
ncbi:23S rRNA (uridine(2552)-2'-O)-methyltransferase RlmE [Legionella sp. W05-934-2]|uniref:23S rRNA (uridine(2552)-2'-O)-methyltransferase RlmE n=1 Tax=Legionella sp. W05-934-2 TaxID=1198649 RepID=UPI003462DDA6